MSYKDREGASTGTMSLEGPPPPCMFIAAEINFTERGLTVSYPDFSDNGENRNVFSKGGHKGAFSTILFFSNLIFLSSRDLNTKGK